MLPTEAESGVGPADAPAALLDAHACLTTTDESPPVETWRSPVFESVLDAREAVRRRRARSSRRRIRDATATTLKVGLLLFVTYALIFNFSVVRGSSMAPGIHDGDRILIDHLSYVFSQVERGDVIVLEYPLDPSLDYIKRVIGLPGDDVRIAEGRVWINDELLVERYVDEPDPRTRLHETVASDTFFVMGDNRPHSSDSREFGLVPRQNIIGKVDVRVWPPSRAGIIE